MRVSLDELMDKLAVGRVLSPYETLPWSCYDGDKGVTCSAEVRMSSDSDEVEAEVQLLYDEPPANGSMMEQICYIRAEPAQGLWAVKQLRVRGEPYGEKIYDWEGKSCDFFQGIVQSLQLNEIPDIDILLDEAFSGRERIGGGGRGGGGKKPKINSNALSGLKKGRGF